MPVSRQLLKPAGIGFILTSVVVSLILALIPWGPGARVILPDFVAVVLVYWCMNQPRHVGIAWAFWLGLVLDIADGNVIGQHSLAYCFCCWLVLSRQRRLGNFPLWQQALYVLPVMLSSQVVMVLVRLAIDRVFPAGPISSAASSPPSSGPC